MLNLLASSSQITSYIILGVLIVAIILMFVYSSKRRKKQEQEAKSLIDSVKPGNKVKTIGGICGIVVEVDSDENTFVLETGTEQSGKCFIKFDRQAIYQTDAVVEKDKSAELPAEPAEVKEAVIEEPAAVKVEEVKEEAPVEVKEEAPAEKPAPKKTTAKKTTSSKTTKKN